MKPADVTVETRKLKQSATGLGADLVGVADLSFYRDQYGFSRRFLGKFSFAVSIAVRLSNAVVEGITVEDPTEAYVHHYATVNAMLDGIALRVSNYCQARGFDALPVSASQVLDEEKLLGAVSHKGIAILAGLGWMGKSFLVVNENFGPRLRLASVLTTYPLDPDKQVENLCGDCVACVKACPAGAIKGKSLQEAGGSREAAIDVHACNRRLRAIAKDPRYGRRICGVCVKTCPWGTRQHKDHNTGRTS